MVGGRLRKETVKNASFSGIPDGFLSLARYWDTPGMWRRSSSSATKLINLSVVLLLPVPNSVTQNKIGA